MPKHPPGKPIFARLGELAPGDFADFFALLAERTPGKTRDGKAFYTCRLRDARRSASYMVWSDADNYRRCAQEWEPGMFFKVRATYGEHERYGPQVDVAQIRPINDADRKDGFKESDFYEHSRFDSEDMFKELRTLGESTIENEPLRKLALTLLDRHEAKLKVLPATQRTYYPFPGGWLEHTLSVTRKCLWLVEQYRVHYADMQPPLNRDVVAAGAMLHEIGRVVELEPAEDPAHLPEATVAGRLLGHLFLGRDLVRDAAREQGDVPAEHLQLLEHLETRSSQYFLPEG